MLPAVTTLGRHASRDKPHSLNPSARDGRQTRRPVAKAASNGTPCMSPSHPRGLRTQRGGSPFSALRSHLCRFLRLVDEIGVDLAVPGYPLLRFHLAQEFFQVLKRARQTSQLIVQKVSQPAAYNILHCAREHPPRSGCASCPTGGGRRERISKRATTAVVV